MKLKVGDCEIPDQCLRSIILYNDTASVAFTGILAGDQMLQTRKGLRRLAEIRALPFEAVDRNGVSSTGICDIKHLTFSGEGTSRIKFSGWLVRPFQD